jgi:glycosyltransferase involved in cell wall biosynthesis
MQPLELGLALQGSWGKGENAWIPHHKEDTEAMHLLSSHAWRIINGLSLSTNILSYRDYILASRGEFTVAKDQYARLRSGWFSDRSACYLAAGRPVVTQDTGFGKFIPTGEGLFAFNTMEEIVAALEAINTDYERHSRAARKLAAEHFSADRVLGKLLQHMGLG